MAAAEVVVVVVVVVVVRVMPVETRQIMAVAVEEAGNQILAATAASVVAVQHPWRM